MKSFRLGSFVLLAFINMVGIALPYPILSPLLLKGELPPLFHFTPLMTVMILLSLYPFGQFLGSPILGSYSDKKGAKPVLTLSLLVTSLGYLLSAFAISRRDTLLFAFSRFFTGLAEGNFSILRAEVAKIATSEKERLRAFGYLNASATTAWLVGPLLGSFLSGEGPHSLFKNHTPFLFGSLMGVFGLLLCLFVLSSEKTGREYKKESVFRLIATIWKLPSIPVLLLLSFCISLSVDGFYEFFPSFLVRNFGATPRSIATNNITLTVTMIFTQSFLVPKMKVNYLSFLLSALIFSSSLLYLSFGFNAFTLKLSFIGIGVGIANLMTLSTSAIAKHSSEDLLGSVMGSMDSLRCLGDGLICLGFGFLAGENLKLPFFFLVITMTLAAHFYGLKIKKLETLPKKP